MGCFAEILVGLLVRPRSRELGPGTNAQFAPKLARGAARTIATVGPFLLLVAFHVSAAPASAHDALGAADPAPQEAPNPGSSDASHSPSLPQVTVEARREAIEPQVRAFVSGSLYLENDEAPARWNSPVCPEVIGLSHDEGEFILARLSQIARAAAVPLAGEQCAPSNVMVIATAKPEEFLKKWGKMRHWRMFAGAMPSEIDHFIDTPRPVRVWYNSMAVNSSGMEATPALPPGITNTVATFPTFSNYESFSRITSVVAWNLTAAIVVVDKTRLQQVTRGQLADYIGVSAFLRLKTSARHGDAPTILGLFDGAAGQHPPGLTAWDEAFLESLYHTSPKLRLQRNKMVTRMVSHIVPERQEQPP